MTGSPSQAADGHARRVAQNDDQLRLAEHLIATARDRLSGRDEGGQELAGIRPRERVVLGVLLPQPRPLVMSAGTASPVPYEPGVPVDHLPASEMGLTALIEAGRRRGDTPGPHQLRPVPSAHAEARPAGLPLRPGPTPGTLCR